MHMPHMYISIIMLLLTVIRRIGLVISFREFGCIIVPAPGLVKSGKRKLVKHTRLIGNEKKLLRKLHKVFTLRRHVRRLRTKRPRQAGKPAGEKKQIGFQETPWKRK